MVALLAISAGAIVIQGSALASPPEGGSVAPLIFGVLLGILGLVAAGAILALGLNLIARLFGRSPDVAPAPVKPGTGQAPPAFLYDNTQLWLFSLITVVVVVGFLVARALAANVPPGYPLDRLPDLSGVFFTLPGTTIKVLEWQAFAALVGFILFGTLIVGVVLSFLTVSGDQVVKKAEAALAPAAPAKAAGPAAKPAPAKPAEGAAAKPAVFLYDNRQRIVFYGVVAVIVGGFLLVRFLAQDVPLAYPFDGTVRFDSVVMTLPGDIEDWPEGVPGPGQPLLVWQALIGLGALIVGTVVVGFGLARGVAQLDQTVKATEKATGQWPAPELQRLEPQVRGLFAPGQRRHLSGLDRLVIALIGGTLLLFAVFVLPSLGGMFAADASVEGTRVAQFWTPTPPPGPSPTPGPSPDEAVAALPAGVAANGEAVAQAHGCVACHVGAAGANLAGPSWVAVASRDGLGIAEHAASRYTESTYTGAAASPAAYLYESIVNPNVYVVEGYAAGIMPGAYGTDLSPQELADLVAYLETLR
jgi:cytochrome c2